VTVVQKRRKIPTYTGENIDALNGATSPLKLVSFTTIKFLLRNMSIYAKEGKKTQ